MHASNAEQSKEVCEHDGVLHYRMLYSYINDFRKRKAAIVTDYPDSPAETCSYHMECVGLKGHYPSKSNGIVTMAQCSRIITIVKL